MADTAVAESRASLSSARHQRHVCHMLNLESVAPAANLSSADEHWARPKRRRHTRDRNSTLIDTRELRGAGPSPACVRFGQQTGRQQHQERERESSHTHSGGQARGCRSGRLSSVTDEERTFLFSGQTPRSDSTPVSCFLSSRPIAINQPPKQDRTKQPPISCVASHWREHLEKTKRARVACDLHLAQLTSVTRLRLRVDGPRRKRYKLDRILAPS